MRSLSFYQQKRRDGGRRTGVEVDGERILESFEPGSFEVDTCLDWFIDVRWKGKGLPTAPEAVRAWILEQSPHIKEQLRLMAEELAAGIDPSWPFTRELPKFGKTPQGKIVCSVARRLSGREIGDLLAKLERSWEPLIAALPATDVEVAA